MPLIGLVVVAAIIGLIVGGLINWPADILPRVRGYAEPAVCAVADCTMPPPKAVYVPLLGPLLLAPRCANGHPTKWRYWLSSLGTAIVYALLTARLSSYYEWGLGGAIHRSLWDMPFGVYGYWRPLLFLLLMAGVFILIFVTDAERKLIFDYVTYPSMVVAIILLIVLAWPPTSADMYKLVGIVGLPMFFIVQWHLTAPVLLIGYYISGGVFGLAFFGLMYVVSLFVYRKSDVVAFGFGDVKLAVVMGLALGPVATLWAMLIGSFVGSLIGIFGIFFLGWTRKSLLPLGAYFAPATLLMLAVMVPLNPWP